ncbi:hypothetical protein CHU92_09235 [Flavobacterium cyanobacteriorum]|uniref:Uncharacterized protein n=2 Tax=Flavobacterium cyanobacteriorum TaxID=2022802 RepID=A0A255Z5P8_9FLAO|nr:hypothetical protein CHU92_09235 [Flavobacterium cyanobacteriorum]
MDIQSKKIELIQWLSTLDDISVIEKVISLRQQQNKDWWDTISENEKKSIEKGINDSENGNLLPHTKAQKLYEKWL